VRFSVNFMTQSTPRHRALHPMAQQLAAAHEPIAFFGSLPTELRRDPSFVCEAMSVLALASNTTELARRVGMSRMGLRKAMTPGSNPSFGTMVCVARELGLCLELRVA